MMLTSLLARVFGTYGMRPQLEGRARGCPVTLARSSRAAGWLPGERVRGGEPAAQLVVKVSGRGDADSVGE